MSRTEAPAAGFLARMWRWLKGQLVGEVPAEIAVCEFDCRKQQCTQGEWENCERRLSHAANTLAPEKRAGREPAAKVRRAGGTARGGR